VETDDLAVSLGRRLRARRAAHDETLAAVAARAGLSVPYIANLENGRGNPTLAALARLAAALGARLVVDLPDQATAPPPAPDPPASLVRFAQTDACHAAVARIAEATGRPRPAVRELLLTTMTALGSLTPDPTDLTWHRVLDAATLIATQPPA
jgi:transcriptional regulator with XRE-family HTH domain